MTSADIETRLAGIRARMRNACERAGRDDAVTLIAVTKTVDVVRIRAAYAAGQRVFGENKVQEAVRPKSTEFGAVEPTPEWHYLGHLQTNKIRPALGLFTLIHSVDTLRLARSIDRRASELEVSVPVLLEVNVAAEESKSGFSIPELRAQAAELAALSSLQLRGLMTIAPEAPHPEEVRWVFRRLRELRDSMQMDLGLAGFTQLSMGMSGDYEVAIEEGATMVRIGRAIFGERHTLPVMGSQ